MEPNLESVTALIDTAIAFAVQYGFQILGALVVLVIGLTAPFAAIALVKLSPLRSVGDE